jgi:diguanylate cyclase (GGDEF)-like protein
MSWRLAWPQGGRELARWLHLPALTLATTAVSVFLSVEITGLLLSLLQASGRLLSASHLISVSVPLMIAPAASWLVGGLIVRAQAGRRRSEELAAVDPLTGLLNRRRFFELAEPLLERSLRANRRLALLLLDVDHFKRVNDTHGHATGDAVLKALAECCIPHLRESDLIARLGGEEFVVLFEDVTELQARKRAEYLRIAVATLSIDADGTEAVRPTVSIGVAMSADEAATLDMLLEVADRAMYAAKQRGRNRTCFGPDCLSVPQAAWAETFEADANSSPRIVSSRVRRAAPHSTGGTRPDIPGGDHVLYGLDSPMLARLSETLSRLGRRRTVLWFTGLSTAASVGCAALTLAAWHAAPRECLTLVGLCLAVPAIVVPLPVWAVATLSLEAETAQRSAERLASTDSLTGLCNRRHFFHQAEPRFDEARRSQGSLTMLLFDIDHFKSINDTHGHAVGDQVLAQVARISLGCLRDGDIVARYGGEEFVALLPDTPIEAATPLAERLRAAIAQVAIESPRGGPIRVTLSIGASEIMPVDTRIDALIDRADEAMYRAKKTGRNRVCAAA